MNERIKLLADEAAKFSAVMALPTGESGDALFVEKFAELIIQECAHCVDFYTGDGNSPASDVILKHFGVEE